MAGYEKTAAYRPKLTVEHLIPDITRKHLPCEDDPPEGAYAVMDIATLLEKITEWRDDFQTISETLANGTIDGKEAIRRFEAEWRDMTQMLEDGWCE